MVRSYPTEAPPWSGASWIDLCDPTEEERAAVAAATGLPIPTRAAIDEIETTSRTFAENDALYLSTPLLASRDPHATTAAVGFVLSAKVLITVRFASQEVIDSVRLDCDKHAVLSPSDVFLRLVEAFVDNGADTLERASAELDESSRHAFLSSGSGSVSNHQRRKSPESLR